VTVPHEPFLLTPGPTEVPAPVLEALARALLLAEIASVHGG